MVQYVKDFDFKKTAADMSADKCAKYAMGGRVKEMATGESYPSREAMMKRESKETPRMQREEMPESRKVVGPARRSVPVAPAGPMIAMKKGGMAKGGMHKMPDGKMMADSAMKHGGPAKKMSKAMGGYADSKSNGGSKKC